MGTMINEKLFKFSNTKKTYIILFLMLAFAFSGKAQFDTLHYIAPVHTNHQAAGLHGNVTVNISTNDVNDVNVDIYRGDMTLITSAVVTQGSPQTINLGNSSLASNPITTLGIDNNLVKTDKGLIIKATGYISVAVSQLTGAGNRWSVTSKGTSGFGKEFRSLHLTGRGGYNGNFPISVIATEPGVTTVNFTVKTGGVLVGIAGSPHSVNLNQGEIYTVRSLQGTAAQDANAFGTLITSDKDVSVTTGSWLSTGTNIGSDSGFDVLIPAALIGSDYIVQRGKGTRDLGEYVRSLANVNNTDVWVDGVKVGSNINAGDFVQTPVASAGVAGQPSVVTFRDAGTSTDGLDGTSVNGYVVQSSGANNGGGNTEPGMAVIPTLECTGTVYSEFMSFGTAAIINIVTLAGATVEKNGIVLIPDYTNINAAGELWDTYSDPAPASGTNVIIESSELCHVGMMYAPGVAGAFGFYTNFSRAPQGQLITNGQCAPDGVEMEAIGSYSTYQWYFQDDIITGATSNTYTAHMPGYYTVEGTSGVCGTATSPPVFAKPCDTELGVSKFISNETEVSPNVYDITYKVVVENFGPSTGFNIQVSDTVDAPACAIISVVSYPTIISGGTILAPAYGPHAAGTTNPNFTPGTDNNLLTGYDSIPVNSADTIVYTLKYDLSSGCVGAFSNSAYISASTTTPNVDSVDVYESDYSNNGTDPDPNGDGNPDEEENTIACLPDDLSPGTNGSVDYCIDGNSIDLFDYLGGTPNQDTAWWTGPAIAAGYQGSITPSSLNGGTYTFHISADRDLCPDQTSEVVLNTITPPAAPTGTATQDFCAIDNPTVADLTATGTAIQWYAAATGGTALATTTALVDATHYYASQTVGGCESDTRFDVTVSISDPAAPTGTTTQDFCAIDNPTVAELSATGTTIQWYAAATGGTALATTDALVDGNHYYATQTVSGCESDTRFDVTVSISDPAAPTGTATQDFCAIDNPTVAELSATGTAIQWYSASTGGTVLATTDALVDATHYYASQTVSGCESDIRFDVTVNIGDPAAPTGTATQDFCAIDNSTVAELSATGTTIQWYASSTGGTALATTDALIDGNHYYASQTVSGCESDIRFDVTVSISDPAAPTGTATQDFCAIDNSTVAELLATGTAIQWYAASTGGTALATTDVLVDGNHYYASQTVSGCESDTRFDVTVTINDPTVPTGDATQSFCPNSNSTIEDLSATGTAIQWYSASTGGTALVSTTILISGTHYYASQTVSGCVSNSRLSVLVIIEDIIPPNINSCAADLEQVAETGCETVIPNFTEDNIVEDNCTSLNNLIITQYPEAGTIVKNGLTVVTITFADENGNESNCTLNFEVVCNETIIAPEGFSPNGDDVNDYFILEGLEAYPDNSIKIFNRWGNIVYTSSPYTNNWDGTYNRNQQLPTGTYFYVLDLGEGFEKTQGNVYLNR